MLSLEYIAGFFDGEGSIVIFKHRDGHYQMSASIGHTYRPILEQLKAQFGGWLGYSKIYPHQTKQASMWRLTGNNARSFLRTILPYLVEKQVQAEIALQMPFKEKPAGYHVSRYTIEEKELQESIYQEVKRLKYI